MFTVRRKIVSMMGISSNSDLLLMMNSYSTRRNGLLRR